MPATAAALFAATAVLALDLAGVTPPSLPRTSSAELRVDALELDDHLLARLTNVSARPLEVAVGRACGGPTPLVAYFDSDEPPKATPLVTARRPPPCADNALRWVLLQPGAHTTLAADNVSTERFRHDAVAVAYQVAPAEAGVSASGAPRVIGPVRSRWTTKAAPIIVTLRVEGDELVADHLVAPPSERQTFLIGWKGACPRAMTALVVDDVELPGWPHALTACAGPSVPEWRELSVGDRWSVRGPIPPGVRGRQVHARYRVSPTELSSATWVSRRNPWPRFWGRVDTVAPLSVPR